MLVKLLEEVEGLAKVDRTSISAPTLNGHSYNWSPKQPLHIHPLQFYVSSRNIQISKQLYLVQNVQ